MKISPTIFAVFMLVKSFAQSSVDSTVAPVKTMSFKQYNAYLDGNDISGMALVAWLNHYPSPEQAIALKKELNLNPQQVRELGGIITGLLRKKKEMGRFIIKNEQALDSLFNKKLIDDGTLIFYTNRYGLYLGELRNAVLQSYLKVNDILNAEQKKRLAELVKP